MKKYLLLLFLIFSIVSFADDEEIDYSQIPQNIMDSITANAEERYPTDYEMQNYIIDQQARAYLKNRRIKGNKTTSNSNIEKRIDDKYIEYKELKIYSPKDNNSVKAYYSIFSKIDLIFTLFHYNSFLSTSIEYENSSISLDTIDSFVFNIDGESYVIAAKKRINDIGRVSYKAYEENFNSSFFKALSTAKQIDVSILNNNEVLYSFQVSEDSISKINIFSEFCIKKMNM